MSRRNFIFLIFLMVISITGLAFVLYKWFTNPSVWNSGIFTLFSILFLVIIFITYLWSVVFIVRQKRISRIKTDFINNMTHEFKTPITTVSIAADSLLSDETARDEDRIRFFSAMIKKEIQRMNQQVERILQVARLDRKQLGFTFQRINVHDQIDEAVQGFIIQIQKRGGKIERKFKAEDPFIISDPIHFINIVHNLLDNAAKYSSGAPEITISTENDKKGLYMSVEDKGIGMSKKIQSKIFDRYYRLTSGILTTKGFGIGLNYIRDILKINKGRISVKSELGKGSRFTVFFPFFIKGKS